MDIIKFAELPFGRVELRANNVLFFEPDIARFKEYNIPILEEMLETFVELTDGIPRPYLCDNRYITGLVNKEEQVFINNHFGKFATKAALLTHSPVMNVLINTYHTLFKPKVIIKLFTTEEDAVTWLLNK